MNRTDVQASRDLAARYVEVCDALLAERRECFGAAVHATDWTETWQIVGKQTGAHRRLSLDLTRALSHMRRRR